VARRARVGEKMTDEKEPWVERTVDLQRQEGAFQRGVARVGPRVSRTETFAAPHHPTGTGWPGSDPDRRLPAGYHLQRLRLGSGWSIAGALFAFVCWGVWAISAQGDLTSPVVTFVLTLLVAVGLFALARLLGRVVWEQQMRRVRRSARGAHLVTAVFLTAVGVAYLRQTEWVMSVWNWATGLL
jgi:hypothetical protein